MAEKTMAERRKEELARRLAGQARGGDEHLTEPPKPYVIDPGDDVEMVEDEPVLDEVPRGPVIEDPWPARKAFLLSLIKDPELRDEITDDELRAMDARITKKARDERRKAALSLLEEDMLHRARVDENLIHANTLRSQEERARLASKVRVRFDLPDEGRGSNRFRVDGREYGIHQWYEMTVAEMESIRETHYRMHLNDVQFRTLDQAGRAGLGMNNRAQGTTAAHVLLSRQPAIMEVEPILV
jgi:hypothetical protein